MIMINFFSQLSKSIKLVIFFKMLSRILHFELNCINLLKYSKYDVELIDKDAPLDYSSTIINTCNKLNIKMKPRQD